MAIFLAFMAYCSGNEIIGKETNIVFSRMDDLVPDEEHITPRNAANIHYFCLLIGSIVSIFTIQIFGRKTLAVAGMAVNAVVFTVMSITIHYKMVEVTSIMIFSGAFLTACTYSSVYDVYTTEVSSDVSLALVQVTIPITALLNSQTAVHIIDAIGLAKWFSIYAVLDIIAFFVLIFVMKESKGLTDKQKKRLYRPEVLNMSTSPSEGLSDSEEEELRPEQKA